MGGSSGRPRPAIESVETGGRFEALVFGVFLKLLAIDRPRKRLLVWGLDLVACTMAVFLAFSLRVGALSFPFAPPMIFLGAAVPLFTAVFYWRHVYHSIFRYSGGRTIAQLATAVAIYSLPLLVVFLIIGIREIPRTVAFLQPMIFFLLVAAIRIGARYILTDLLNARGRGGKMKYVLVYGAGNAGQQLAMSSRHDPGLSVIGFLDDDARLDGQRLDGLPVYHSSALAKLIERVHVDMILLAMPNTSRARRAEIVSELRPFHVEVMTLPDLGQLVDGKVSVSDLRQIQIEDVLGRDAVQPNELLLSRTVVGKAVMVTGAGGSIGSELCRQIIALRPRMLVLVEMTEHALYLIEDELRAWLAANDQQIELVPELLSVTDTDGVERIFARYRPDTVFHAAAYKHVPLVEANPLNGLGNNVFGTLALARAARHHKVGRFILISTDKAVRPTNVMGASKRICELVLQAIAETIKHEGKGGEDDETIFSMVRFGNVLGSSGSVVPRFQQQIKAGGPVTLTHRDVTRYFMTIPEAAQLVMQAGAMATGGEVFVLDMGEPVRIFDLARTMIELAGLTVRDEARPDGDIEIVEIGLRPGEKLYEELLIGNTREPTQHAKIMRSAEHMIPEAELTSKLGQMREAIAAGQRDTALAIMRKLVPEYAPGNASGDAAAAG
ncbi:polysaccharide biosynthesis protein [Tsuneonella mangrovi]|uniref:polysaccharide biosynthesis protein n=1 Tax=Tsuneonella mangrovi TaxID=1982042 RepID=UPI001F0A72C8|nr:nucleoside-diphosphate sugar epimerase/dehydratase [Tsuneonella mangrovi]